MRPRRPFTLTLEQIRPDQPLRLDDAARLVWPDGSMTVSGLRKEAAQDRLVIERMAGKDFVTLAAIDEMRKLCRLSPKERASGSGQPDAARTEASGKRSGSSATEAKTRARDAALTTLRELRERSKTTSTGRLPTRSRKANVIPLASRSPP